MKQAVVAGVFVVILAGLGMVFFNNDLRDDLAWNWFSFWNDENSYQTYLNWFPAGKHAEAAKDRVPAASLKAQDESSSPQDSAGSRYAGSSAAEAEARARDALRELEDSAEYQVPGDSRNRNQKQEAIARQAQLNDDYAWDQARTVGTLAALRRYRQMFPQGRHTAELEEALQELNFADAPFDDAVRQGTPEALEEFLRDLPGHKDAEEARARLADLQGFPITALMEQGLIQVRTRGESIITVVVAARRLEPRDITVVVPLGTFFIAHDPRVQNMLCTMDARYTFRTDDWQDIAVSAACANREKRIPTKQDTFDIAPAPTRRELSMLAPVMESAKASYGTQQAAVWIVTDDANWNDLGILQRTGSRIRAISANEAIQALQLIEQVGLRLENYAIWEDFETIITSATDKALIDWLRARMRQR